MALGGSLASPVTIAQAGSAFSLTGGNVGIGTATPQSTLDVSSGVVNATLGTTAPGTSNVNGTALGQSFTMPVAGPATSLRLLPNATFNTTFVFRAGSGNAGTALSSPQPISFVKGAYFTVALTTPLALAAGVYTLVLDTGANSMLYVSNSDSYIGGSIYQGTNPIATADLDFAIAYSSGSATSAFSVGSSGNVGIGTSAAPSQQLEVAGGSLKISTAGQGLIFPNGSTQTTAAAPAAGRGSYIQNPTSPQAGSILPASASTALGAGQPYQLRPDAAPKTVIALSDGANWTIGYIN